ncbi:hypothetical protein V5O48_008266 [Marasmius crinis-equi]|uniref:Uncharacterized protein n=1 Tax=Marasmius crinis-equi TaxID=585013 RepID=A0ABR3FEF9_9AGAR
MFAKYLAHFVAIAALALSVVASPIAQSRATDLGDSSPKDEWDAQAYVSLLASRGFSRWGGFTSLDNFDNFYGADNFAHARFDQVVVKEHQVVCHTQVIEVIQQRLVVLQEMAKRIITEQICEVETQTIVFSQFHASLGTFHDDLRRHSSHQVGFDSGIVGHYGGIVQSDGSLSTNDLGFTGADVGKNTVVAAGNNWVDGTSPKSVDNAYFAAQGARSGL